MLPVEQWTSILFCNPQKNNGKENIFFHLEEAQLRGNRYSCEPHWDPTPYGIEEMWKSHGDLQNAWFYDVEATYNKARAALFHPPQTRWFRAVSKNAAIGSEGYMCEHWILQLLRNNTLYAGGPAELLKAEDAVTKSYKDVSFSYRLGDDFYFETDRGTVWLDTKGYIPVLHKEK